jgi:hypothetical protein
MIVVVEDWKMRCDATTKSVWTLYTWLPHHWLNRSNITGESTERERERHSSSPYIIKSCSNFHLSPTTLWSNILTLLLQWCSTTMNKYGSVFNTTILKYLSLRRQDWEIL